MNYSWIKVSPEVLLRAILHIEDAAKHTESNSSHRNHLNHASLLLRRALVVTDDPADLNIADGFDGVLGIGDRIKLARARVALTQEEVATKLGVTITAVSQWESNANAPDLRKHLPPLADILGVRAGWLAFGDGAERA